MALNKRKDLSVGEKLKVIDALTQKKTQMEVAKEFGISQTQVSRISGKRDEIRQKAKENANITEKDNEQVKVQMLRLLIFDGWNKCVQKERLLTVPFLRRKRRVWLSPLESPALRRLTAACIVGRSAMIFRTRRCTEKVLMPI